MAMLKTGRHEGREAFLRRVQDHRQRNSSMVLCAITAFIREEMKLVGVQHVAENHFTGIELFFASWVVFFLHTCFTSGLLGKGGQAKKEAQQAESRHYRGFGTSHLHTGLQILREDKERLPKMGVLKEEINLKTKATYRWLFEKV